MLFIKAIESHKPAFLDISTKRINWTAKQIACWSVSVSNSVIYSTSLGMCRTYHYFPPRYNLLETVEHTDSIDIC